MSLFFNYQPQNGTITLKTVGQIENAQQAAQEEFYQDLYHEFENYLLVLPDQTSYTSDSVIEILMILAERKPNLAFNVLKSICQDAKIAHTKHLKSALINNDDNPVFDQIDQMFQDHELSFDDYRDVFLESNINAYDFYDPNSTSVEDYAEDYNLQ